MRHLKPAVKTKINVPCYHDVVLSQMLLPDIRVASENWVFRFSAGQCPVAPKIQ